MKHAYLIMAHNEPELLRLLLRRLDHKDNTIYLHCDSKFPGDPEDLGALLQASSFHSLRRRNCRWGHYSLVQVELELLKAAVADGHDYYHLLSGTDLPIRSHEEIDAFFQAHSGVEFVSLDKVANETRNFTARYDRWHFRLPLPPGGKVRRLLTKAVNLPLLALEKVCDLLAGHRSRKFPDVTFMKGSQFFDITHDLAAYVVEQEPFVKKAFRFTALCDEVFLQTVACRSPYADRLASFNIRYIDWHRHGKSPEILTPAHYEDMMRSGRLYARKFSSTQSKELIEMLYGIPFPPR